MFYDLIKTAIRHPICTPYVLYRLFQHQSLTRENIKEILDRDKLGSHFDIFHALYKADLLDRVNIEEVLEIPNVSGLSMGINRLANHHLLTERFFQLVVEEKRSPEYVAHQLCLLNQYGLLNYENIERIKKYRKKVQANYNHWDVDPLSQAFILLGENGLLNEANVIVLCQKTYPHLLAKDMVTLHERGLLTPENQAWLLHRMFGVDSHGFTVKNILILLTDNHLYNQDNRDAIYHRFNFDAHERNGYVRIYDVRDFITCLGHYESAGLLTQSNLDTLLNVDCLWLVDPLRVIRRVNLITQANLDRLMGLLTPENRNLLFGGGGLIDRAWRRIPAHLFTQHTFNQLCRLAEADRPEEETRQFIHQLFHNEHHPGQYRQANINNQQSTHTKSVHKTSSESAKRLFARYHHLIKGVKLHNVIDDIYAYLLKLEKSDAHQDKNSAALRALLRLQKPSHAHTDHVSQVSILQLLALSWCAIHDEQKRDGNVEDGVYQFVHGLYEIQREYNLSASGVDDELVDKPACVGGTFNKLIEKLVGIHPDCNIHYMTKKTAALKLPKTVNHKAEAFFTKLANSQTKEAAFIFLNLIEKAKQTGSESLWPFIKTMVEDEMLDEFKDLFENHSDEFVEFVSMGAYCDILLPFIDELKLIFRASPGYQKYCSALLHQLSDSPIFSTSLPAYSHEAELLHSKVWQSSPIVSKG